MPVRHRSGCKIQDGSFFCKQVSRNPLVLAAFNLRDDKAVLVDGQEAQLEGMADTARTMNGSDVGHYEDTVSLQLRPAISMREEVVGYVSAETST